MRFLPLFFLLAACGGGPQLSKLRCRDAQNCQHPEDPFRVLLAVDFSDPSGTFGVGALELRVNGSTQQSVAIADLFAAQGIDAKAVSGTLDVDQEMVLDRISQGQQVTASLIATNGQGKDSNQPSVTFTLHLGN